MSRRIHSVFSLPTINVCSSSCISLISYYLDFCQRYLGTVRESDSLNILMEFVPGGSISSLLEKFGSFPEPVSPYYT